jgi:hypothetical protein
MKIGFTDMIQKQSNICCSRRAHNHQEQKKAQQVLSSTKSTLIVFLTWRGLFTVNLFLLTLWSTLTFTVMFWEKMCEEKDGNFGASTTGSFITTTHPPTHPWKPQFVTNNNMVSVPHSPYWPDLTPWFCFVSQIENETEGMTFWNSVWHPKGIARGTRQH